MSNIKSFIEELDDFPKEVEASLKRVIVKTTEKTLHRVLDMTLNESFFADKPAVWTGDYLSSHYLVVNAALHPTVHTDLSDDIPREISQAEAHLMATQTYNFERTKLLGLDSPYALIRISNDLDYAELIEKGGVRGRPSGRVLALAPRPIYAKAKAFAARQLTKELAKENAKK